MGRKRAKHKERISSQSNKMLKLNPLSRTAKTSGEFKTLAWFGDLFKRLHGEGILVYVKNLPLMYIRKSSNFLNPSDELLFLTYDKQKQIIVSYPMADNLPGSVGQKDVLSFLSSTVFMSEAISKESPRAKVRVEVPTGLSEEDLRQSFLDYEFIF